MGFEIGNSIAGGFDTIPPMGNEIAAICAARPGGGFNIMGELCKLLAHQGSRSAASTAAPAVASNPVPPIAGALPPTIVVGAAQKPAAPAAGAAKAPATNTPPAPPAG